MRAVYRSGAVLRYTPAIRRHVITFDAGQTLVELDLDFLATRLGERGHAIAPAALAAAAPAAWARYDALEASDAGDAARWHALIDALLAGAGVTHGRADLVAWLRAEQPRVNLWRRPIADMVALARALAARGHAVAVISNSEGGLAELLAEIGIADPFAAILDSGRLPFEKPDPRMFAHALAQLGLTGEPVDAIHIGDLWAGDVAGALAAGWRAIWYGRRIAPVDDARVGVAHTAAEARDVLVRWGVLLG